MREHIAEPEVRIHSSPAESLRNIDRAVVRLARLAAVNKRIRAKDKLTDPNFLRSRLAQLEPQQREAIEVGRQKH